MTLSKSADTIQKADNIARKRRVMWSSLDDRIKIVFDKFADQKQYTSILGNIYLTKLIDNDPIRSSGLLMDQHVNSTHVHTGCRSLGIKIINTKENKLVPAVEKMCQLWYSQSPYGNVLVFIAPYKSNAGKIEEKEIIIGKYKEPASITQAKVEKHFNIFFKYCACTSQNNASSLLNYLYRQYLIYNDFRYKASYRTKFIKLLERILILMIGGAAVWASLYASGKI